MSIIPIEDVLAPVEGADPDFITEDDALEIEEVYEEDGMDVESDGDDGEEGEEEGGAGEGQDDAETMLDNGLDDSTATYSGHEDAVFAVALHPVDPLIAVSGGADDMGHIWRTDNGEEIAKLEGHTDSVSSVGFSFDGEMVATGGMDGRVRVWRRVKGSEGYLNWEFVISLEGPDEVNVRAASFLGRQLPELMSRLPCHLQWINWHPKGNLLLAGGADGTVWLWQCKLSALGNRM